MMINTARDGYQVLAGEIIYRAQRDVCYAIEPDDARRFLASEWALALLEFSEGKLMMKRRKLDF